MANVKTDKNSVKKVPERKPVDGIVGAVFKSIGITVKSFFRGIFSVKHWLKIILLVLLSMIINVVRAGGTGIDIIDGIASTAVGSKILGVLSFLLYAGGGVSKNVGEIVTGTLAKTICAAFIVSVISGKMKGTLKGIKLAPGSLIGKYMRPSKALVGFGFALVIYAVTCGKSGYAGIMVVISMCACVCKALGGNGEILRTLSASLNSYKVNNARRVNLTNMNAMLAGGALGSIFAYAANNIFETEGCILVGAGMILLGAVLGIFTHAKCKAEVQA